jgi:hypothetical protein
MYKELYLLLDPETTAILFYTEDNGINTILPNELDGDFHHRIFKGIVPPSMHSKNCFMWHMTDHGLMHIVNNTPENELMNVKLNVSHELQIRIINAVNKLTGYGSGMQHQIYERKLAEARQYLAVDTKYGNKYPYLHIDVDLLPDYVTDKYLAAAKTIIMRAEEYENALLVIEEARRSVNTRLKQATTLDEVQKVKNDFALMYLSRGNNYFFTNKKD